MAFKDVVKSADSDKIDVRSIELSKQSSNHKIKSFTKSKSREPSPGLRHTASGTSSKIKIMHQNVNFADSLRFIC